MQSQKLVLVFTLLALGLTALFFQIKKDKNTSVKAQIETTKTPSSSINQSTVPATRLTNTPQTVVENPSIPDVVEEKQDIGFWSCVPDMEIDEEKKLENIETYFNSLSNSPAQKDRLYHALFAKTDDDQSRLDLLFNYINQFSAHPIAIKNAINLCTHTEDKRCSKEFINSSAMLDDGNGAIWLSAMSYYANKGDDEGVMESITKLIQAPIFNERYGESGALYALALEGSTENHFSQNAMLGLASSSIIPSYSPIVKWCRNKLSDIEKSEACITLGQNMEIRSKTTMTYAIGLALQEIVFESQNNNDLISEIKQKRKILDHSDSQESDFKTHVMIALDERLTRSWLNNLDTVGELEAQKRVTEEAKELYQQNENYLCSMINDVVNNF